MKNVSFPLTPALSLEERGNVSPFLVIPKRFPGALSNFTISLPFLYRFGISGRVRSVVRRSQILEFFLGVKQRETL